MGFANRFESRWTKVALTAAALAALATAAPAPALAGSTYHNVPGSACGAFNNTQANRLERNHVRIYNPPTSSATYVICPVQKVVEDINDSASLPGGYINVYFSDASAVGATVPCTVREYIWYTEAFPGTNDAVNQVTVTATRAATPPDVADTWFDLTSESTSNYRYYTITCLLAPGTGINSIDFQQR